MPAFRVAASDPLHRGKNGTFHQRVDTVASATDWTAENQLIEAKILQFLQTFDAVIGGTNDGETIDKLIR